MTTVPPTIPKGGFDAPAFPYVSKPYSNITPFTYRDGQTHAELMESFRDWIVNNLVPFVNTRGDDVIASLNDAIVTLGSDRGAFESFTNDIRNATIAARDEAQTFAANTVALQDVSVQRLIADTLSATRTQLRNTLDQTYGHRDEQWIADYMRDVDSAPRPEDNVTVTWTTDINASAYTSPKIYRPYIVLSGAKVTNWDGQNDTYFRFFSATYETGNGINQDLGVYGSTKPGGASQAAAWPVIFEFVYDGDDLEIGFYSSVTQNDVLLEVNGRMLSNQPFTSRGSNANQMRIKFNGARSRTIRVYSGQNSGFTILRVPTNKTISKPSNIIKRRIAFIGDSYVNGAGNSSSWPDQGANLLETFAIKLARYMQADDIVLAGIGGTGYTNGGAVSNYASRLDYVLAKQPNVLIVYGSQNDTANSALRVAVDAFMARTGTVPEVWFIGSLMQGTSDMSNIVKDAAKAANKPFIEMLSFINGSGNVLNIKNDGNADYFRLSDNAHPTLAAHRAIAKTIYSKMRLGY